METATFLIQCPDQKGLVSRISTFFFERGFNILHCQQYTDVAMDRYYMRLVLDYADLRGDRVISRPPSRRSARLCNSAGPRTTPSRASGWRFS